MQHTFFVHFFDVVLHDYNVKLPVTRFMEEMSYAGSRSLFFHCRSFSPCIAYRYHFSSCHRRSATKFLCCSRSRSLSPFFSLSFAGLPLTFSFSLSYSFALYSKLVDMTINVRIQRQFPVSAFVFSCLCFIRRE